MTDGERQATLLPAEPESADAIVINDRCVLRAERDPRVVVVAGVVVRPKTAG